VKYFLVELELVILVFSIVRYECKSLDVCH
jgi:hypothetical protein